MAIPDNPRGSAVKAISGAIDALRTGEGLKGQLLRGGVGSIAVKIGSTLINVLLAIVLARTLGVEGFGVYSFVFALITIMAIPAQMGLPNLVVRETAKAQANGDWALMKGLWRWSTLMALAMSIALMALGAAAAWLFAAQLPEGGLAVFYWGLVLVPLIALGNLRGAALRGLRHVVQGQLPEFILRPAFLIVLVLGMHFGLSARTVTASDAMLLHAIASLAAFAIGAWMLLRARPGELREAADSEARSATWLKSALPLGMITGLQVLNQSIGLVLLGILGSNAEVGYLRIAIQGSHLIAVAPTVVFLAAGPHLAQFIHDRENNLVENIATYAATGCLVVTGALTIAYIMMGEHLIVWIIGDDYLGAHAPLLILCVGQLVNAATALSGTVLIMAGSERFAAYAAILSFLANCFICALSIHFWGVLGAAVALSSAIAIEKAIHCLGAYRIHGINTLGFRFNGRER